MGQTLNVVETQSVTIIGKYTSASFMLNIPATQVSTPALEFLHCLIFCPIQMCTCLYASYHAPRPYIYARYNYCYIVQLLAIWSLSCSNCQIFQVVELIRYWATHCSSFSYSLVYTRHQQHALFIYPLYCMYVRTMSSHSAAVTSCRYFAAFNTILLLYKYYV